MMWSCLVYLIPLAVITECTRRIPATLNTTSLIESQGYDAEEYKVESDDGFITQLFRIPRTGPPVLLMHGLLVASDSWLLRGRDNDLAFIMSDLGYDVWLSDLRGNIYSRQHKFLSPTSHEFWDFSVHEMGSYDLPAVIDRILQITGYDNVLYVGHSLGTTMFYVMCSTKPEYVYKVKLMIGLAPAAFFGNFHSALLPFFAQDNFNTKPHRLSRALFESVLVRNRLTSLLAHTFCSSESITQVLCMKFMSVTAGLGTLSRYNHNHVNKTLLPHFLSHLPTGASLKTINHLAQMSISGRFCQYDYGPQTNMEKYGSPQPPDYQLSRVTLPVLQFYSPGDRFVDERDIKKLADNLPALIDNVEVANRRFNHMDFIWSQDANQLIYDKIIETIVRYT